MHFFIRAALGSRNGSLKKAQRGFIQAIILQATPGTHDEDNLVHALRMVLGCSLVLERHFHTESCCFEDYRLDAFNDRGSAVCEYSMREKMHVLTTSRRSWWVWKTKNVRTL